jgi:hypothetical protein
MAEIEAAAIPPDTLLTEELSDDIVADMANLCWISGIMATPGRSRR